MSLNKNEFRQIVMWKNTDSNGIETICEYLNTKNKYKVSGLLNGQTIYQVFRESSAPVLESKLMSKEDLKESKTIAEEIKVKLGESLK